MGSKGSWRSYTTQHSRPSGAWYMGVYAIGGIPVWLPIWGIPPLHCLREAKSPYSWAIASTPTACGHLSWACWLLIWLWLLPHWAVSHGVWTPGILQKGPNGGSDGVDRVNPPEWGFWPKWPLVRSPQSGTNSA